MDNYFIFIETKGISLKNSTSIIKYYISILLLVISFILCGRLIYIAKINKEYRVELAETTSIQYGLLNVDEWKVNLAKVLTQKVEEFELTAENQEKLKPQIENMLNALLNEVELILKSDVGKIKRLLMNVFIDMDKLRESIPEFADSLLEELSKPENKESIKDYIMIKLDTLVENTYSDDEQTKLQSILEKYNYNNKKDATYYLEVLTSETGNNLRINALMLVLFLFVIFILNSFRIKNYTKTNSLFLLSTIALLLICGITMPMIDIEAKISRLTFHLLNEYIVFDNQVLFFQSKSILDVVWVLLSTWKIDMVFVSFLIFGFSILFPVLKLLSSFLICFYPERFGDSKTVYFFAFKSGKWSMADVFVVALFMAFIGFNGIVSSQLEQLNNVTTNVEVLTTNGTNLQVGFYLFLLFCLGGLFFAEILQKIVKKQGP